MRAETESEIADGQAGSRNKRGIREQCKELDLVVGL
jgi:hypothetical protein